MCSLDCCILYTLTMTILMLLRPNVPANVRQKLRTSRDLPVNPNYILPVTANPTEFGKQQHRVKTWGQRGLHLRPINTPFGGHALCTKYIDRSHTRPNDNMSSITNRISESHQIVHRMTNSMYMYVYVDEKRTGASREFLGIASDREGLRHPRHIIFQHFRTKTHPVSNSP